MCIHIYFLYSRYVYIHIYFYIHIHPDTTTNTNPPIQTKTQTMKKKARRPASQVRETEESKNTTPIPEDERKSFKWRTFGTADPEAKSREPEQHRRIRELEGRLGRRKKEVDRAALFLYRFNACVCSKNFIFKKSI